MAKTRSGRSNTASATVATDDVLELLGEDYGPVEWTPRFDPASELVSTILSQHTSDVNSERAFENLMNTFGSLEAVAQASVVDIEEAIRLGGLARVKAPRIKAALKQVVDDVGSFDLSFLSEMPLEEAKAWLKNIPGIGPKTAAIILCFSMGLPAMAVDTHVYRVSKRLGLIGPKVTADQAHDILESSVASEDVLAFHTYLIQHGRQVCKAQRPRCGQCALSWGCPSRHLFEQGAPVKTRGKRRSAKSSSATPA